MHANAQLQCETAAHQKGFPGGSASARSYEGHALPGVVSLCPLLWRTCFSWGAQPWGQQLKLTMEEVRIDIDINVYE